MMNTKMRDQVKGLTFKEAISSYSERAKFVKTSSKKTFLMVCILLFIGVVCFGLNAYVFLFGVRRFLHVWHSLMPIILMIYPLCTGAWVTKQYTWFIIVVVRAWVHQPDNDETSDEDSGIDEEPEEKKIAPVNKPRRKSSLQNLWGAIKLSTLKENAENTIVDEAKQEPLEQNVNGGEETQEKTSDEGTKSVGSGFASTVTAIQAINKLKKKAKRSKFNFEKFLSYLESMRPTVGFHIAGIMVTWDLVSTTLFLLFSVVAVFMQESIFGSTKSTIDMDATEL